MKKNHRTKWSYLLNVNYKAAHTKWKPLIKKHSFFPPISVCLSISMYSTCSMYAMVSCASSVVMTQCIHIQCITFFSHSATVHSTHVSSFRCSLIFCACVCVCLCIYVPGFFFCSALVFLSNSLHTNRIKFILNMAGWMTARLIVLNRHHTNERVMKRCKAIP